MPSSITEEDIVRLREARYLTGEIPHRLPAQGQVIPTPKPGESVVFVSHFLRGLGLTPDPFVRGLMFYYGLDFHDLAPESILHISSFIVVWKLSYASPLTWDCGSRPSKWSRRLSRGSTQSAGAL